MIRTLDEIKDEVSLEDVLVECGASIQMSAWGNETPFYCPFHLNTNTPAGSMNALKGVWTCYSCGAGGTVIDAALLHLETDSITKAREWLEEEFL